MGRNLHITSMPACPLPPDVDITTSATPAACHQPRDAALPLGTDHALIRSPSIVTRTRDADRCRAAASTRLCRAPCVCRSALLPLLQSINGSPAAGPTRDGSGIVRHIGLALKSRSWIAVHRHHEFGARIEAAHNDLCIQLYKPRIWGMGAMTVRNLTAFIALIDCLLLGRWRC